MLRDTLLWLWRLGTGCTSVGLDGAFRAIRMAGGRQLVASPSDDVCSTTGPSCLVVKLTEQLGLHREPRNPRLSQRELDLRRRVFHEAFMLDCILSLTAGQRIALVPEEIDAQYPSDATAEDEMKYSVGFGPSVELINSTCETTTAGFCSS